MNKLFATIIALLLSATAMAQSYEQLVEKAEKCAKSDSLAKAEELYKEALKQNPYKGSNALVFSNLGKVQEAQGKNKEALESYTYAINMAPTSVPLRLNRAGFYLQQNALDKALLDYTYALDINPKTKEALLYRAYIYVRRRELDKAKRDYTELLSIEPNHYEGGLGMALLNEKLGKRREAIEQLTNMLVAYP